MAKFLCLVGVSMCLLGSNIPMLAQKPATPPKALQPPKEGGMDAVALQLLQKMADAYAHLSELDQETEYFSALLPLAPDNPTPSPIPKDTPKEAPPPADASTLKPVETKRLSRKLHLIFQQPNHLMLEIQESAPTFPNQPFSRWVSDGKTFWTYLPEKNYYTREKAPGKITDFPKLNHLNSGCLELLMVMGVNPFANVKEAAESVRYEGRERVKDVETEVVLMRSLEPGTVMEARFYIGKEDFLLRRVVTEKIPLPVQASAVQLKSGQIGDSLDELYADAGPAPAPVNPTPDPNSPDGQSEGPSASGMTSTVRSRFTYHNIMTTPSFNKLTFQFTIPPGALLYGSTEFKPKRNQQVDEIVKQMKRKKKRGQQPPTQEPTTQPPPQQPPVQQPIMF